MKSILAQIAYIKKSGNLFDIDKHRPDNQTDFRNNSPSGIYEPIYQDDVVREDGDKRKIDTERYYTDYPSFDNEEAKNFEDEVEVVEEIRSEDSNLVLKVVK
jgi:hypothetical protein